MIKYVSVYVFSVFISSIAQIFLKKSADTKHESYIKEYLNIYVVSGYIIFVAATMLTIFAYRKVPLSKGPVIESLGYIFVCIMEYMFFNRKISKKRFFGILLIMFGIFLSCLPA